MITNNQIKGQVLDQYKFFKQNYWFISEKKSKNQSEIVWACQLLNYKFERILKKIVLLIQ